MPLFSFAKQMPVNVLLVAFTLNAVISQLVLRRALNGFASPSSLSEIPRFIANAALSPWIYGSLSLQVVSYVIWMLIVSREKLGVATASAGAGFYLLVALCAWLVYGETLSPVQWAGIFLVTVGVACISLGGATL
jgi:drug/metabolite transporter (DMT)-like permease